jgi:hypothetical protein
MCKNVVLEAFFFLIKATTGGTEYYVQENTELLLNIAHAMQKHKK